MLSNIDFDLLCKECGVASFNPAEIPENGSTLPVVSEAQLTALMSDLSARDSISLNFLSAGRYNNFIPAIVRASKQQLESTPNLLDTQLNIDIDSVKNNIQHSLQTLSGMPFCAVFDADLVSLLVKVLILSQAGDTKTERSTASKVLIPATVSPVIRNALRSQLKYQDLDLVVLDYDKTSGCLTLAQLESFVGDDVLAIVLACPNFFGQLGDFSQLSTWAKNNGSLVIGLSDPLSLSLVKSPFTVSGGQVDYLLGDLQALGLSASQGGHSPTYLASSKKLEHEWSGYAQTHDISSDLQVIQAYLSVVGLSGLHQSATQSNAMLNLLVDKLTAIGGVTKRFSSTAVNECVIEIAQIDIQKALKILAGHNMVPGYLLQDDYPELSNCLTIYCSNQHTLNDVEKLAAKVATVVKNLSTAGCPVKPKF